MSKHRWQHCSVHCHNITQLAGTQMSSRSSVDKGLSLSLWDSFTYCTLEEMYSYKVFVQECPNSWNLCVPLIQATEGRVIFTPSLYISPCYVLASREPAFHYSQNPVQHERSGSHRSVWPWQTTVRSFTLDICTCQVMRLVLMNINLVPFQERSVLKILWCQEPIDSRLLMLICFDISTQHLLFHVCITWEIEVFRACLEFKYIICGNSALKRPKND